MRIGRMRHLMTLQNPVRSADGQGGKSKLYTDQEKLWAEIEPTSGNKKWEAAQVLRGATHVITTHYTTPYRVNQKLVLGEREFIVRGVVNVGESNKELQWQCEELTD